MGALLGTALELPASLRAPCAQVQSVQALQDELATLLAPLLLARRAEEVALASVRRGITCSLYDTFAAQAAEEHEHMLV